MQDEKTFEIRESYHTLRDAFDEMVWACEYGTPQDWADRYAAFERAQREAAGICAAVANKRWNTPKE